MVKPGRGARGALLAVAVALAAAGAGCSKDVDPATPVEQQGEVVAILRRLPPETSGGIAEPLRAVVKDAAALEAIWKRAMAHRTPLPAAPSLDFTKEMLVLASLGKKPTGGWSVEIVGARSLGGKTVVLVSERAPAADETTATVITHPWHAVILPATEGPVEWMEYVPPARR